MEIYLDNSSTTQAFESVKDIVGEVMCNDYGNPSSKHMKGFEAESRLKASKEIIAKSLKATTKEIYFTSGGTESNNMALIGTALANKRAGNHIITTSIEHPSVLNTMKYLEKQGFKVTYLPVDSHGVISIEKFKESITNDTILVSTMYVNNEIGSVQPIEEIGRILKQERPDALYHVDAVQAFGKYIIHPKKLNIDLMSISGHKIHGPKGIGILYVKEKTKIKPIVFGGGQQDNLRSGTENVPGIAGIGQAVNDIYKNFDEDVEKLYLLKDYFIGALMEIDGVSINSETGRKSAPHIVSASIKGIKSEVLLHSLEERSIYVSSGSACASNKNDISSTLKAIGLKNDLLDCTIRFSFSICTTKEELDVCIAAMRELIPVLGRYTSH